MAKPQIYEGTIEEITNQLGESNLTGRFKAIVVPESETELSEAEELGPTIAERMKSSAGQFDFGGVNLSLETGRKFTDVLVECHQKSRVDVV